VTFRYRLHRRGLALSVALSLLLTGITLVGFGSVWRVIAVAPFTIGVAASLLWVSELERARWLGALVLDGDGIRRVRSDGRLLAALRWEELRKVVVDRRRRMVLFEGRAAKTLYCHGTGLLGGVGVDKFDALLMEVGRRTCLPLTPVSRRWRRRSQSLTEAQPATRERVRQKAPARHAHTNDDTDTRSAQVMVAES
jgi:hypothetical protein